MIIGSALLGYQLEDDFFYFLKYREIATVSGNRKKHPSTKNDGLFN